MINSRVCQEVLLMAVPSEGLLATLGMAWGQQQAESPQGFGSAGWRAVVPVASFPPPHCGCPAWRGGRNE